MHPHEIIERMELVLLRAIYLEAQAKSFGYVPSPKKGLGPDDIEFEFSLINEQQSNLPFSRQRDLIAKMTKGKTIDSYFDGSDDDWDKVTKIGLTVQLKTLEARYAVLSRKYPDKGFLWYKAPDSDAIDVLEEAKLDFDAPYEFGYLHQDRNKQIRFGKIPLPLPDHLRILLVYFMAKPGYTSDKEIFRQLHPVREFQAGSIKTMQKYVSAIRTVLKEYTDVDIARRKYEDAGGYELVQVKERHRKPKAKSKN
jgi:hypothetical protein